MKMVELTNLDIGSGGNEKEIESDLDDWNEVFAQLDPKDGVKDGRICKDAFLEWIDTLNFQATVLLEASHGIPR